MYSEFDEEYGYVNESCTVEFTESQYEEVVSLAMDCGLSVKQLIMYRLFGSIED